MEDDVKSAKKLATATRKLKNELRKVFLLKKLEGRKFDDIAGVMGCSVRTVKYRMEKAMYRFSKELKKRGIDLGS